MLITTAQCTPVCLLADHCILTSQNYVSALIKSHSLHIQYVWNLKKAAFVRMSSLKAVSRVES